MLAPSQNRLRERECGQRRDGREAETVSHGIGTAEGERLSTERQRERERESDAKKMSDHYVSLIFSKFLKKYLN